jgi:HPr kinase/phosphorylase
MSTGLHSTLPPRDVTVQTLTEPGAMSVRLAVSAGAAGLDRNIIHPASRSRASRWWATSRAMTPERVQILGETEMSFLAAMAARRAARRGRRVLRSRHLLRGGDRGADHLRGGAGGLGEARLPGAGERGAELGDHQRAARVLDEKLAPRTRVHGVFIDVFGVGILLLGKSGIGKSECALELVQRGHRLVADDLVDCVLRPPESVYGAPRTC